MLAAELSAVLGIIATFAFVLIVLGVVLYALVRPFTHVPRARGQPVAALAVTRIDDCLNPAKRMSSAPASCGRRAFGV